MRLFQLALLLVLSVSSLAFGQGFDSNYEVRLGAFSGSTADDLYISQTPQITILPNEITIPIVLPAPVEDFVLENNGDGTFTLIDDLTDIESSVASNWAEVSIELSLGDFNADGYVDLFLEDVGSVLTGVYDQMVFAQMDEQVPPQAVTAITPDVEQFFEDIVGWLMDENYFENEAYANNWYNIIHGSNFWAYWKTSYLQAWGATYAGVVIININEDPYNPANAPASCNVIATCVFMNGQWYLWGGFHTHSIEYDYSNFDQDAISLIPSLQDVLSAEELVAGSAEAVAIANVFAGILGVPYMGGVLGQYDGNSLESEPNYIPYSKLKKWRFSIFLESLSKTLNSFELINSQPQINNSNQNSLDILLSIPANHKEIFEGVRDIVSNAPQIDYSEVEIIYVENSIRLLNCSDQYCDDVNQYEEFGTAAEAIAFLETATETYAVLKGQYSSAGNKIYVYKTAAAPSTRLDKNELEKYNLGIAESPLVSLDSFESIAGTIGHEYGHHLKYVHGSNEMFYIEKTTYEYYNQTVQ